MPNRCHVSNTQATDKPNERCTSRTTYLQGITGDGTGLGLDTCSPCRLGSRNPTAVRREVMKVFVTGGSRCIGKATIAALIRQGQPVEAMAHSEQSAATVRALGATTVIGDHT